MKYVTATVLLATLFTLSQCQLGSTTQAPICRDNCTCAKIGGCDACLESYRYEMYTETNKPAVTMETAAKGRCVLVNTKSLLWFLLIGLVLGPILIVLTWCIFCPKGFESYRNSQCGCHPNPENQKINNYA